MQLTVPRCTKCHTKRVARAVVVPFLPTALQRGLPARSDLLECRLVSTRSRVPVTVEMLESSRGHEHRESTPGVRPVGVPLACAGTRPSRTLSSSNFLHPDPDE